MKIIGSRKIRLSGPGNAVIEQNNVSGRVSYWVDGAHQSVADTSGISLADYIHAIYAFLRQTRAHDVLMIGCGGGTLATMLDRDGVNVTVVDIDARSIELARRYFHLPDSVTTYVADGAEYLRRTRMRYDAIVLDAYNGDDFPDVFKKLAYLASVKAHLTGANAIYLENMLVDDDEDRAPDNRVRLLQTIWPEVRLLDCDGWVDRNAVIAAGAVRGLRKPKLLMPPSRGVKKLERDLESLRFRRLRN
ncbi:MAG: methyltransferase domain-containing protein [Proteobacteria bacterium]|nr:methyltransferase domain-containing protein [Pseudomonadota bacterium]